MFLRVRIACARCAAASHRHLYMVWVGVDPGNPPLAVVAIRRPSSSVVVHRRRASSGSPWGHFSSSCAALVSGPKSNPRRGAIMGPFCRFTIRLRDGVGPGGGQEADPNQGPQSFGGPLATLGPQRFWRLLSPQPNLGCQSQGASWKAGPAVQGPLIYVSMNP